MSENEKIVYEWLLHAIIIEELYPMHAIYTLQRNINDLSNEVYISYTLLNKLDEARILHNITESYIHHLFLKTGETND